jgi:tetratricopeptide (TPR) repeat protein
MAEGVFDLELEAFRASGVKERYIVHYKRLFKDLQRKFLNQVALSEAPVIKAKQAFDWLWQEKPNRYKPEGNYKLSDVLESQLSEESRYVGNCLGLTILYNCLLKRIGVYVRALQMEYAFGKRPHVLSLLPGGHTEIHIENILRQGFDYKGHLNNPLRIEWGDREIVADIYHSRGNDCFQKGKFTEALICYDKAIDFNPRYEKAQLNKTILMARMSKNSG